MDELSKKLKDNVETAKKAVYDYLPEPNYELFDEAMHEIYVLSTEIETMWNRRNV